MVVTPVFPSVPRGFIRAACWTALGLLLSLAPDAFAAPLTVAWDAVPEATGYLVHYGEASRHYTATVDVGDTTTTQLVGLDPVRPSYIAVTAYNDVGDASAFSNEVLFQPAYPTVVWTVNAGGPKYTDAQGLIYRGHTQVSVGTIATTSKAIAGTTEDGLYQTAREGEFSYTVPVADGTYLVTLQFAEIIWTKRGQRVFHVLFEGAKVLTNLDLVAAAGPNTAYTMTLPVLVTDGRLNIAFRAVVDEAIVSAIVVQAN
jgi:malectin (di-glucose binding ER protein)